MNPKITTSIFALIAFGALAFAGFLYVSQLNGPPSSPTTSQPATAVPTETAESTASPTSTDTASASRVFSENAPLSLPNQVEAIPTGGSLSSIASDHGLSISELAKINGISDPNKVYAGQSVIVPDVASSDSYIILYVLNEARLKKEELRIRSGQTSLYADPILAAQADTAGIYGLTTDTPYSKSAETPAAVTLSTSLEGSSITIAMEKHASDVWIVKKVTIKHPDSQAEI